MRIGFIKTHISVFSYYNLANYPRYEIVTEFRYFLEKRFLTKNTFAD